MDLNTPIEKSLSLGYWRNNMLLSLLTVLFVGLKLTNFIDWSWWYVLLPAYGGFLLAFFLFLLSGVVSILSKR
jgi:hypothetical protein